MDGVVDVLLFSWLSVELADFSGLVFEFPIFNFGVLLLLHYWLFPIRLSLSLSLTLQLCHQFNCLPIYFFVASVESFTIYFGLKISYKWQFKLNERAEFSDYFKSVALSMYGRKQTNKHNITQVKPEKKIQSVI